MTCGLECGWMLQTHTLNLFGNTLRLNWQSGAQHNSSNSTIVQQKYNRSDGPTFSFGCRL